MKQLLLFISFFILTVFFSSSVQALDTMQPIDESGPHTYDYEDGCTKAGQCLNNRTCVVKSESNAVVNGETVTVTTIGASDSPNCNSSSIGAVRPPGGVQQFDQQVRQTDGGTNQQSIGIIVFISNLLWIFAIVAGIWAMFNFIKGGFTFITSMSDAGAMEKVKNSITMTVIGLVIIASAYIIAGLIGLLMFGDASFILSPKLDGAI